MESREINPTYQKTRSRLIGHKVLRLDSDSISSESSCNQNSTDYPLTSVSRQQHSEETNEDLCIQNQTLQMVEVQDHDEELNESIEECEMNVDDEDNVHQEAESVHSSPLHAMQHNVGDEDNVDEETDSIVSGSLHTMSDNIDDEGYVDQETESSCSSPHTMQHNVDDENNVDQERPSSVDDHTLVEGVDYDIITVYTVNPDEIQDDDEEAYAISEKEVSVNREDNGGYTDVHFNDTIGTPGQDRHDQNLDGHVVSNIDEYFIKNNNNEQDVLDTDEQVVKDVDEYFFKSKDTVKVLNIDDFFSKHPLPEEDSTQFKLPTSTPKVKQFLAADTNIAAQEKAKFEPEPDGEPVPETSIADICINESDLEILRNLCMDIDDSKLCLGFEDRDLYDITSDNEKDKSGSTSKSDDFNTNVSDDLPRTLSEEDVNSFLITDKTDANKIIPEEDDFSHQDMEIESSISPEATVIDIPSREITSIPIPRVLDFCIEKTTIKEQKATKIELDDFLEVESRNDTVYPVLEVNDSNSLFEHFEANEKFNTKNQPAPVENIEDGKVKSFNKNSLTNGMRLQDAGENKSLLQPEVLPNNSRILNSRHRTCKSKKVVYHFSSDEETNDNKSKNKKLKQSDDIDPKKKNSVKTSDRGKNLSLFHSVPDSDKKINSSVMIKNAYKTSDTNSQNSNGKIRLTIKNKSGVSLTRDHIDSQKVDMDKCSVNEKTNNLGKKEKTVKELDIFTIKEEPCPKNENFYATLFNNKQDVQIPQAVQSKAEKRPLDREVNKINVQADINKQEQPQKRKKLTLQEYKLRKGVCSNNSSTQVSPEAIFPDLPSPGLDKAVECPIKRTPPSSLLNPTEKVTSEQTYVDPIIEASRRILMKIKKRKTELARKRDEDIVMSKIPKVENLQLQPLMSEAEMMKMGMTQSEVLTVPVKQDDRHSKLRSPVEKRDFTTTTKIKDLKDPKVEHGRRRSRSKSLSRSRGRSHRYRRSDSPYERKRRSRSPNHKRRSPSVRRERSKISRLRSRSPPRPARPEARSKTPMMKPKQVAHTNGVEKNVPKSLTPPLRKSTVSKSSDSSSSSQSSSSLSSTSSSSSSYSRSSKRSCSSYNRDDTYKRQEYRNYSSKYRSRYDYTKYQRARDAWSAVEAASTYQQYDAGFGGRRAFCKQRYYADHDDLKAKYKESAFNRCY